MNTDFRCIEMGLKGVKLITPFFREDERGYFLKSYEKDTYGEWGLSRETSEDFESLSGYGVIRGLHFQTKRPQIKLIRVILGSIMDVIVDIRKGSPTYGQYEQVELSEHNHRILLVPAGFAHGFEVLSDQALVTYKCFGKYLGGFDSGIRWDDTDLNIPWSTEHPILSVRDQNHMSFREFTEKFGGLDMEEDRA